MIFTGGQVDLTPEGVVRNPGDLTAQCAGAMDYLCTVLEDLGASAQDLVRLVVYFVGDAQAEAAVLWRRFRIGLGRMWPLWSIPLRCQRCVIPI